MRLPIRIMTRGFDLLDEIDGYDSLQLARSWHGIGAIDLRVNRYLKGADKLQRGNIIFPHNRLNKGYVILHREIELDEKGRITENWNVHALSIKAWFAQRLTYPPAHTGHDNKSGDAESVMRHYVDNNVINPADPNRAMPDVIMEPNQNRGANISWQSRYKNLADELGNIGLQSGLGWNIDIDLSQKKYVFRVSEGLDLTASQTILPPAIFSPEFGTLGQLQYTESELDYKNFAVVAGQGEGADRRIVEVGEQASGFDRYELFVDARDVSEETDDEEPQPRPEQDIINDLTNRGQQKLTEHEQEVYMEGQALMGRVEKRIPTNAIGTLPNSTISEDEINVVFITAFQPVEDSVTVTRDYEIRLSHLGHYQNSEFNWSENAPTGTNITVMWSVDQRNWQQLYNGQGIELEPNTKLNRLYIQYVLTTDDHDVVPSINNFEYEINGYTIREVVSTARLLYESDYDLGDMVTLQNKDWGITMDARITEVKEIYEAGRSPRIELTYGNDRPTLIDRIKDEMSGMITEITR